MTQKIAGTFNALLRLADFSQSARAQSETDGQLKKPEKVVPPLSAPLQSEFHYNIQIHLPANGSEETYINISNALRGVFV